MPTDNQIQNYLERCISIIADHGFIVQAVAATPFAYHYTIGLTPTLGYELLTIGLPHQTAHAFLNGLAKRLANESIVDGLYITGMANIPMRLKTQSVMDTLTGRSRREIVNMAFNLDYNPTIFRQLFWPDINGIFPGETAYSNPCSQSVDVMINPDILH